ncbi:MAG TPA: TolC family protein [Phycisphaerales bacterium]|nr:TolC family protein [Phycisphaerales bacterium]
MPSRWIAALLAAGLSAGCRSPLESTRRYPLDHIRPPGAEHAPPSAFRQADDTAVFTEPVDPEGFVRYALLQNPGIEAAYQRWVAAVERLPQVSALPDPRLTLAFFLDEVETRTGAQQARVGIQQRFPWPGLLERRKDAAALEAVAAWYEFESERLDVTERVLSAMHDLAALDRIIAITTENRDLLASFEDVLRARYRVGAGSHPELIRVQVELGQIEDRLEKLRATRPVYVAELNAAMNRPASTHVDPFDPPPGRVLDADADQLAHIARQSNPTLLAMDQRAERQLALEDVAKKEGMPDFAVGLDTIITNEAGSPVPESGDDPVLLTFGVDIPLWRDKYDAAVRQAVAARLAIARERDEKANAIAAAVHRAWFEHTDADRRVRLYENTLIPKARESLRASLASFRTGESTFLDLLDTERTLLEFDITVERARADRGKALARLNTLTGGEIPGDPAQMGAEQ